MLNDIGRTFDDDPRPCLYVGPTEKNVAKISTGRVTEMIRGVPSLRDALAKGQKDKVSEKVLHGVSLNFAWAGSPTELASTPAARVYIDERDRMLVTSEGDVDEILDSTVATYDGILIRVSTPLLGDVVRSWDEELGRDCWTVTEADDIASPIWSLWQEGSRHEWATPCPHCNEYIIVHSGLLSYDEDGTDKEIFRDAFIRCPANSCVIENHEKAAMNARGVFLKPNEVIEKDRRSAKFAKIDGEKVIFGDYLDRGQATLSFWVSGLHSPWRSYGHRARSLNGAKKSKKPAREQGVINTQFGEVYKPKGAAPDWNNLKEHCSGYMLGEVPDGVRAITCGVDVHATRLNYVVRGWGVGYESWLLDYGELFGSCKYLEDLSWRQLHDIINDTYNGLSIPLTMIDAGYNPNDEPADASTVYQFCYANKRAAPAKGYDRRQRPHSASVIDVNYKGKAVKKGLQLWHLDTDHYKSFIYSRYEWPEEAEQGHWHLPTDISDEYCRQASSEARMVIQNKTPKWEKIRQANHFLDCEMLAAAAAHVLRIHTLKDDDEAPKERTRSRSRNVHNRNRR